MKPRVPYSEEVAEAIIEGLIDGKSLRQICLEPGMPNKSSVFRWMDANPEFATKCARARALMTDDIVDDMVVIEENTLNGSVDPAAARVVLASKQWRAMKLAPKKYGAIKDDSDSSSLKIIVENAPDAD